jgi:serpin B
MQHHTSEATPGTLPATDVSDVVTSCNRFACDLHAQLAGKPGNLFYSPSSVSMALAMAFAGANTETADELARVLHATLPRLRIHEAFRELRERTATGGLELKIANRLWGQRGYSFLPDYLDLTERCYGARLAEVDFQTAPDEARQEINDWVAGQTANKIRDLIAPGSFHSLTRLILTNAIYFKGGWQEKFSDSGTVEEQFWIEPGRSQPAALMQQTTDFRYAEFDDLAVLEMPYLSNVVDWQVSLEGGQRHFRPVEIPGTGSNLAMDILLPRQIDGLAAVESRLNSSSLREWLTLKTCSVEVAVPKFMIESGFSLSEVLKRLGMRRAFSSLEADFSRISDDPQGFCLEEVIHKAFGEVNEKGTEAAAATGCDLACMCDSGSVPELPKLFRADHPFLFLIRDRETSLIHFVGRVVNPPAPEPGARRGGRSFAWRDAERERMQANRDKLRQAEKAPTDSEPEE